MQSGFSGMPNAGNSLLMIRLTRLATLVAAAGCLAASAHASLLTTADQAQLETWLGTGNLTFTNIYTLAAGDTTADFHAAVDGMGPTITLMQIYGNGGYAGVADISTQIVGGYDPLSWSSSGGYNTPASRDGFIFNLSFGFDTIQDQNALPYQGQFQTYNSAVLGPTFGAGFDLVAGDQFGGVLGNLGYGFADQYSYGGGLQTIVYGGGNLGNLDVFNVSAIEVYTFAPAQSGVPDASGTIGLLGGALAGLAALRRRWAK